jgi:hypothetical protein
MIDESRIEPPAFFSTLMSSISTVKLSPSYNQFESHLNYLLTLDHQVYKDKNDKMMKYFDIFDLNSTPENKLKRIIQKLIQ